MAMDITTAIGMDITMAIMETTILITATTVHIIMGTGHPEADQGIIPLQV